MAEKLSPPAREQEGAQVFEFTPKPGKAPEAGKARPQEQPGEVVSLQEFARRRAEAARNEATPARQEAPKDAEKKLDFIAEMYIKYDEEIQRLEAWLARQRQLVLIARHLRGEDASQIEARIAQAELILAGMIAQRDRFGAVLDQAMMEEVPAPSA